MELLMDLWHLDNIKVIITIWMLSCWLCSFFLYWFFLYCSQSSQLIFKNLILKFPKIHDQNSINLTDIFDFIGNFWIMLGLMKPNGCMALVNILYINLQQCHNYANELILATFSPFAIKCKKLNLLWNSGNVFLGHLRVWVFHIFPTLHLIMGVSPHTF